MLLKPYYQSDNGVLYHGDALRTLRALLDGSVNCCVTSPPYWGLRDYGTAEWVGGDSICDHKYSVSSPYNSGFNERWGNSPGAKKQESERHNVLYKTECKKCGAIRKDSQLGIESTPEEYVNNMAAVFEEVRRVLRDDGTCWVNIGDSYYNYRPGAGQSLVKQTCSNNGQDLPHKCGRRANIIDGLKEKDLVGIPWRVAFALQSAGWYLRQDIIWHKPNPMPERVKDRCTKAHEYIFLLSKSQRYFYDADAIKDKASVSPHGSGYKSSRQDMATGPMARGSEGFNHQFEDPNRIWGADGKRNKRSVWTCSTKPFSGAHFAVFPPALIEPCILAGCPKDGVVLDPFMGSGTTAMVAYKHGRKFVGIELNKKYLDGITIPRIEAETRQLKLF